MSIYWHSTLIPRDPNFVPTPEQVASFLHRCEDAGAFSSSVERLVLNFDHLASETDVPLRQSAATSLDVVRLGRGLRHWSAECRAEKNGRNPPVRGLVFRSDDGWVAAKNHFVAIRCESHGQLASMCDLHEESHDDRSAAFFGDPCNEKQRSGLFSHPHSMRVLRVPDAGCASFHIEFWFGKFIFPPPSMTKLSLIALDYKLAARRVFGLEFAEGCHWG